MMNLYKRNVNLILLLYGLRAFVLWWGVIHVLYLRSFDLSFLQVSTIVIAHSLAVVVMEVPSGILSDRWGRKKTLILFGLLLFLGILLMALGSSYIIFLIAALFLGISTALWSGTDTAVLFESLKKLKKKNLFEKYLSRSNFFFIGVGVITNFLVPVLFEINNRLPYYVAVIFAIMLFVTNFFITDTLNKKQKIASTLDFKQVIKQPFLIWILVYSALFWLGNRGFADLINQPYVAQNFTLQEYGLIFAASTLVQTVIVYFVPQVLQYFKKMRFYLLFLVWIAGLFLLQYTNLVTLVIVMGIIWSLGTFIEVIVQDEIQNLVTSDRLRATISSTDSLLRYLVVFLFLPLVGWFMDFYTLDQSIFLLIGIALISCLVFLFKPKVKN